MEDVRAHLELPVTMLLEQLAEKDPKIEGMGQQLDRMREVVGEADLPESVS